MLREGTDLFHKGKDAGHPVLDGCVGKSDNDLAIAWGETMGAEFELAAHRVNLNDRETVSFEIKTTSELNTCTTDPSRPSSPKKPRKGRDTSVDRPCTQERGREGEWGIMNEENTENSRGTFGPRGVGDGRGPKEGGPCAIVKRMKQIPLATSQVEETKLFQKNIVGDGTLDLEIKTCEWEHLVD